jgi:hypothetical protein
MVNKEYKMTRQEYLADQHEYDKAMDHFDKEGYCEFCGRHADEGSTLQMLDLDKDDYVARLFPTPVYKFTKVW